MERELKGLPLYKIMSDAYLFRYSREAGFDAMMGCLQILLDKDMENAQTVMSPLGHSFSHNEKIDGAKYLSEQQ